MLSSTIKTKLNNGDGPTSFTALGDALDGSVNVLKATYTFATQGGAVSAISMKDPAGNPAVLPIGAIVQRVLIYNVLASTSGGSATIAIHAEAANDLKTATAVASFTLGSFLDGAPIDTAATAFITTAARTVTCTIATAALTAGTINCYIRYVI